MAFPRGQSTLRFLTSPLYVIAVNLPDGSFRKLFQIQLRGGKDPSLFVNFPYVPFESGIAQRAEWTSPDELSRTVNWLEPERSKLTNHRPKYSHHASGEAHFSLSGKILTSVKRYACPLRQINGHAFSVHIKGMTKFPTLTPKDYRGIEKNERIFVILTSHSMESEWVKIVGRLYTRQGFYDKVARLGVHLSKNEFLTDYHFPDDRRDAKALLVSPQEGMSLPKSLILELSLVDVPWDGGAPDQIFFLGGFDSEDFRQWRDCPGFLTIRFPASLSDSPLDSIPSMDLPQRPKKPSHRRS